MLWKNSWFQVAVIAAAISGGCLVMDYGPALMTPMTGSPSPTPTPLPTPAPLPTATPYIPPSTPLPTPVQTPTPIPATPPPAPLPVATPTPPPVNSALFPKPGEKWTNDLGMQFVPVQGTQVLFGVYDVTVQDYQSFIQSSGHAMTGGMYVLKVVRTDAGGYSLNDELDPNASWENPGFAQGPTHPVVGVSWDDAEAFCDWLTQRDRAAGILGANQSYRLPTDDEWSIAVGGGKYPWGNEWPPPRHAGNYADEAFAESLPGSGWPQIPGNDGFARTSPVGSFRANEYGLYDMGGNVWQWCEDWYRKEMNSESIREKYPGLNIDGGGNTAKVVHGASWDCNNPDLLLSSARLSTLPGCRDDGDGFRCVVVVSGR